MDMFSINYHQPLLYEHHKHTINKILKKNFQNPEFKCTFLELRPDYKFEFL